MNWSVHYGSQSQLPPEIDATSSKLGVTFRKDFEEVTNTNEDGTTVKLNKYLEAFVTWDEMPSEMLALINTNQHSISDNTDAILELGTTSETNVSDATDAVAELGDLVEQIEGRVAALEQK